VSLEFQKAKLCVTRVRSYGSELAVDIMSFFSSKWWFCLLSPKYERVQSTRIEWVYYFITL